MLHAIIGLGNPGTRYAATRHNVGFMVVDLLARRWNLSFKPGKGSYVLARNRDPEVLLIKPTTFMNESGQAVRHVRDYFKMELSDLMLVYDDLDIPFPALRLRKQGGPGTHRGMQSVIRHLGDQEFPRLRLGIGGDQGRQAAEIYVLKNFKRSEKSDLPFLLDRAGDAAAAWLQDGIETAMNRFNTRENGYEKEELIHE